MAQKGDSFYFGAKPRKLPLDNKSVDAPAAIQPLAGSTNQPAQIAPPKKPSKKKSFATLRKLSIFGSRKQTSVSNVPEIVLSDGRIDQSIATAKIAMNDATVSETSSDTKRELIDSATDEKVFPEAPGKVIKRRALRPTSPRPGLSSEITPSSSVAPFGGDTVVRSSQTTPSIFAITPLSGLRLVPRQAPPSPASSIKETNFPGDEEARISELSDEEDTIEVPTMMPPSPPVSATYSYTSFPEIVPTTSKLERQSSTKSKLSNSSEEDEINPKDEVTGSTLVAKEQTSRSGISAVMLGKRPSRVQTTDPFAHESVVQRIPRLVEVGSRQSPAAFSKQKDKKAVSPKGKSVEIKSFSFGTSSTPGPSTQPRKTSGPAYSVEAGLRQMVEDERLFAEELRRMEEEDRKLAEELQRIEDEEGYLGISKEEEEEWRQILLIEDEELIRFKEEADRLIHEDEMLARALVEQEEADLEEQRQEHERLLEEERERERAERQRFLDSIQNIGAAVGIRRVERFGRLSMVDLDQLTEDTINRLKQVRLIFSMGLPSLQITKVEWIINEKLRTDFEECREQLRKAGRSTDEILLWHGTQAKNVIPYTLIPHHLTLV